MSPEQINGQPASTRSDVWAFGCVVFEMLTGRAPFQGRTTGEILANVLKAEPDWQRLPADTPDPIRRLLRHALAKDAGARWRDIGDARHRDRRCAPWRDRRGLRAPSCRVALGARWLARLRSPCWP